MRKAASISDQTEKNVRELFELGAHLGHKKNRLHPKARKYIYKMVNGVSIIDLSKTVDKLTQAKLFLKDAASQQKLILVVATKKIINQQVANLCKTNQISYIATKWLPGLLTNFSAIMKNVSKLKELNEQKEQGEWDKFVKHERMELNKQLSRLERFYGGLTALNKIPDVIFLVDSKKEKNALIEARKHSIPVIGLIDTNSNPDLINFPIVLNDDSPAVLQHVIDDLIGSYLEGKKQVS